MKYKYKKLPKFKKGGENKPIVVSNPNDPRLQAYNDSLLFHNSFNLKNKDVKGYYKGQPIFTEENWEQQLRDSRNDTSIHEAAKRFKDRVGDYPAPSKTYTPFIARDDGTPSEMWVDNLYREYQKPTQPVILNMVGYPNTNKGVYNREISALPRPKQEPIKNVSVVDPLNTSTGNQNLSKVDMDTKMKNPNHRVHSRDYPAYDDVIGPDVNGITKKIGMQHRETNKYYPKMRYGGKLPNYNYGGELGVTEDPNGGFKSDYLGRTFDTQSQANKYNWRKFSRRRNTAPVGKKILAGLAGFTEGIADLGIIPGGEQISSAIGKTKIMNDPSVMGAASIGKLTGDIGEAVGNVFTGQYVDLVDTGMDIGGSSSEIAQSYTKNQKTFERAGKAVQGFEIGSGIANSVTGMMSGGSGAGSFNFKPKNADQQATAPGGGLDNMNKAVVNYRYGGKVNKMSALRNMYKHGGKMINYNGATHENGGIPINANMQPVSRNNAVAEVEDGEVAYNNYIFSNHLKPKRRFK